MRHGSWVVKHYAIMTDCPPVKNDPIVHLCTQLITTHSYILSSADVVNMRGAKEEERKRSLKSNDFHVRRWLEQIEG